ncbi:MAG: polyphenol oxidase family protein [Acidimicrobiia bacterium]|nr:polyphenol oxidase family protein [Acidimicrobiia bacterium]NNC42974.1 polyphenol oxidase family protein [Acidimicrobiia bacterium]NND12341.1 polyphenol oxidase family protein [Acidimicrobiia bacterium]NNL47329.1 polyphenol oxidase family protein [Acidimicrobiia bacterium]
MLLPPGFRGAAFTDRGDGDPFADTEARRSISNSLGIDVEWATAMQVHGTSVLEATGAGYLGEGDAVMTTRIALPVAVKTADCVPVVLEAADAVAVVHAGWRGMVAGVVTATVDTMRAADHNPLRAAIGPSIGPCCYEVGPEVSLGIDAPSVTTWGTTSVDLWTASAEQLEGVGVESVWTAAVCTMCSGDLNSYRADGTPHRQAAIGWLP